MTEPDAPHGGRGGDAPGAEPVAPVVPYPAHREADVVLPMLGGSVASSDED